MVAVIGGGVAGLTAAHELALRGFGVTVYERRAFGGKCRSFGVPGSGRGGRRPLPGEHGFRVVFGFYQNLPDTLRRIPFATNRNGVYDNLVAAPQIMLARDGGRPDMVVPLGALDPRPYTADQVRDTLLAIFGTRMAPTEVTTFARRLVVFLSSCDARRVGVWEHMSWWEFVRAAHASADYRKYFVESGTRLVQALDPQKASARSVGAGWEYVLYNEMGRGSNGPLDRVLNAPTNEAWIEPWLTELRRLRVRLLNHHTATAFALRNGRIAAVRVRGPRGTHTVRADWFVCALPPERALRLWSPTILDADPSLARVRELESSWINGIQFYLRERTPIVKGHVGYMDAPWGLTSISQAQFWAGRDFSEDYGDGRTHDCMSVDVGAWNVPGVLYGTPARELTPAQVAREVWEQIKRHLNDKGDAQLRDDLAVSWSLDPGIVVRNGRIVANQDPLIINTAGSWEKHPPAATAIPNLLIAGDYVQAEMEAQTMEAANESARRAVNALLKRSGSAARPVEIFHVYRPPEWEPFKRIDEERYKLGLPNMFDDEMTSDQIRSALAQVRTTVPAD